MAFTPASSAHAKKALSVVEDLQQHFAKRLGTIAASPFEKVAWLRDEGRHGGGHRQVATDERVFNRGSINVSQVHYDDEADRKLASATALSTIIHPRNPHAPSIHMHVSYTELKQEKRAYWRVMADLNPSLVRDEDRMQFRDAIESVSGKDFEHGLEQGEKYFFIPALQRHRGVVHFYLEEYATGDFDKDAEYARGVIERSIDTYVDIVAADLDRSPEWDDDARQQQLDYHTLYLFQVLTLDRGTIFGLIVHDQNDIGIMGSLPSHVKRSLLASWSEKMHEDQRPLLAAILDALPKDEICEVNEAVKKKLAENIRAFYANHPEAAKHLAKADVEPTTTDNHLPS